MTDPLVPTIVVVSAFIIGGVGFSVASWVRRRCRQFAASFAGDADYACALRGLFRTPEVTTLRSALPARLKPASTGGKYPTHFWRIQVSGVALGSRSALTLELEGLEGRLREKLGFSDVKTGDQEFDARFCLRGSDADVVRGVMARPEVKQAAVKLVGDGRTRVCRLDRKGRLTVEMVRGQEVLVAAEARGVLSRVRALGDALQAASMASALPEPIKGSIGSVSSSSGAPIGMRGR